MPFQTCLDNALSAQGSVKTKFPGELQSAELYVPRLEASALPRLWPLLLSV